MSCGKCAKVRAYLPSSIRARLEKLERDAQARRDLYQRSQPNAPPHAQAKKS